MFGSEGDPDTAGWGELGAGEEVVDSAAMDTLPTPLGGDEAWVLKCQLPQQCNSSTVKPLLKDHCHNRPPVLKDHIFLAVGPTVQCK